MIARRLSASARGRTGWRLRDRRLKDRVRLDDLRDIDVQGLGRQHRPPDRLVAERLRRQLAGSLIERRRVERRAAIPARGRCGFHRRSDVLVAALGRPSEVACPGVVGRRRPGKRGVDPAQLVGTREGDDRLGQERVAESDRFPVDGRDACPEGGLQPRGCPGIRSTKRVDCRLGRHGREQQRLPSGWRQRSDPCLDQGPKRLRDRQPLAGRDSGPGSGEVAGDLEGVEGIAARRFLDPDEHQAWERPSGTGQEQLVQRCQRQRAHVQPLPPLGGDAGGQLENRCAGLAADGEQEAGGAVDEATNGVRENGGRRIVEPLGVVDREDQRLLAGELAQERRRGDRERPLVRQLAGRLGPQDRDLQSVPLHGGKNGELGLDDRGQQVGQASEGERSLGLRRRRAQDPGFALVGALDRGPPDRRLADPRLAIDEQARQARLGPLEHPIDRLDLASPPDEFGVHPVIRLAGLRTGLSPHKTGRLRRHRRPSRPGPALTPRGPRRSTSSSHSGRRCESAGLPRCRRP